MKTLAIKRFSGERGQSTVEYILLLSVVLSITLGFFKSSMFKKYFGDQSVVFEEFKKHIQHGYRHGFPGKLPIVENPADRYQQIHESYFSDGNTHFFYTRDYGQ